VFFKRPVARFVIVVLDNNHLPTGNKPRGITMSITENNNTTTVDNGVDVSALLGAREALSGAPELAQFQWRAECAWVEGTHSRTTVERFQGLGAEQSHKQAFVLDTDHPEIFASADNGVTPVEMVLAGLAGCLGAGVAAVATNRGVQLRSVTASLEADMDVAGILGISSEVRNGFSAVRVTYTIDADAPRNVLEGIVAQSQKRSAVYDIISNPTNVVVAVA
jgi:uncharacterized OsmC-like protein